MNTIAQKTDIMINRLLDALRAEIRDASSNTHLLAAIGTLIVRHGTEDERADLLSFVRNPERYTGLLRQTLHDLLTRAPELAASLHALAEPAVPAPEPEAPHPVRRFGPGLDPNVEKV